MSQPDQREVIEFLSSAEPYEGRYPKRIETHISLLYLDGQDVWKLKKAVTLPFLDFSTLEARRQACEQEVMLNRRTAPQLYHGVIPVTRLPDGRLTVGGMGPVVDWLVHMQRFPQNGLLSTRLQRGQVQRADIEWVAREVWDLHRQADMRTDYGGRAGLAHTIATNDATMQGLERDFSADYRHQLQDASLDWLNRLSPLLEHRRQHGLVRWCHGDLHSGNICRWHGRPLLFDAIEFCAEFAAVDCFYDLSFLLMDLDVRGHRALASYAMNHYLDWSGDYQGAMALPLFLSLRAAIRAHVLSTTALGQKGHQARYTRPLVEQHRHAALAYLSPPPPRLLAVGGLSGSGKSRMGRELAPFLGVPGAITLRTDAIRKQICGVAITRPLPAEAYGPTITSQTYQRLYEMCEQLLRAGCSVVADGVFAQASQRQHLREIAERLGVPFDGLWLETAPDVAMQRIASRKGNISDATPAVLQHQQSYDLGHIDWIRIDTGGPKDEALAAGKRALGLEQTEVQTGLTSRGEPA